MPTIGEQRYTSAGNVYRLERIEGEWRYVRRVSNGDGNRTWDAEIMYRWHSSQWEEGIPLVGSNPNAYPHFGIFAPRV